MSAESPNSTAKLQRPTGSSLVVTPQEVTDPTILDSVAGFINEVVPTTNSEPFDVRDQIQWAHFEHLESGEIPFLNFHTDETIPSPLILVLGYTTGIQIWAILANGEATEILSWRHGSVKVLRILPNPFSVDRVNIDAFAPKRPLIALCDNPAPSGSQTGALSLVSLKTSEQVKLIKFKSPILDVLANKQSIVVTFCEKIAIFDAFTLDDRLTVTTCYLSPGIQPNPVALGGRWLAYAEKKLHSSKRSSGGNEGEGVQSYTATVLHAAKSLGRGLRELGETVASSLTGNPQFKPGLFPSSSQTSGQADGPQKGIVTVLDIASQSVDTLDKNSPSGAIIAHFAAHNEAIVCLSFDPSGALLLTADKRGHDFHLFRIHPHPNGSAQAAVHHLYVLHRGDTSAKVQDMCFSPDSRWVSVSTLRGTTHVFAVTPYGGHVGVRTHTTPYLVNKMSRFHRSAGLTSEGRSNSPVSMFETPVNSIFPYHNPRYPPFPHPTVGHPLAQLRQPLYVQTTNPTTSRTLGGRQRLSSSSEENIALRVVACFASPRAWLDSAPNLSEKVKPVESLFVMSCYGILVQYDLEPRHASSVPKERVCDDTPVELIVSAKAQWMLQRKVDCEDVPLPMSSHHLALLVMERVPQKDTKPDRHDEEWLSQVEIVTHAGPHRRLWMGPQFEFKTYTVNNGSLSDSRPIDVRRSKPVNMPVSKTNAVLIESSSAGSAEISLLDTYHKSVDDIAGLGELQLREDLADAMQEFAGRESGGHIILMSKHQAPVAKVVNPLGTVVTIHSDDEQDIEVTEDAVIHENCDEALFRPVVAARPVQHTDNRYTYHHGEDIIVHSLHSTSEVAVRLPDVKDNVNRAFARKDTYISPPESSSKAVKPKSKQNEVNKSTKNKSNLNEVKSISFDNKCIKTKSNHNINNSVASNIIEYVPSAVNPDEEKPASKIVCHGSESCDKNIYTKSKSKQKNDNREKTKLENMKQTVEILQSSGEISDKSLIIDELDAPIGESEHKGSEIDCFETTKDREDIFSSNFEIKSGNIEDHNFTSKYQGLETSEIINEEYVSTEKNISKKSRKPKAKLGVRIPITETATKLTKSSESLNISQTIVQPKISYSAMAASKPTEKEKSPSFSEEALNYDAIEVRKITYTVDAISKPLDMQNSFEKISDDLEAIPVENSILPKPKLSYNVVAASECDREKSPIILLDGNNQLDLSLDDSVENFTVKLPKMYNNDISNIEGKLIDFDSPPEITSALEDSFECQSDSKKDSIKDKSSDDEKIDSPVETTESDDLLTEEHSNNAEKSASSQISKSAKRKARKKKK